jgi:hypothetical protein
VTGGIFGNFQLISVSGNVYNDQNGDGLRNHGEPGLAGWTVNLLNTTTGVLSSVNTDSSGNYSFTGAGPGAYTIAQVVQANWVQTQPLWPTFYSFNATSGHNISAAVFGDHASPALSPTAVIDNGQAGYSETGTWSNGSPGGFNGNNRIARTHHPVSSTATWDFTSLSSGQYDVYVTFARGNTNQSKNAPFSVFDGSHPLGTTHFNESILVTQGTQTQGSFGGVGWLSAGTFTISHGELKVVLNNNATENWVDADGVLIIRHGGSPIKGPSPAGASGNGSVVNGSAVAATGVADLTAISSALMQPSTAHAAAPSSNGSTGASGTGNGSGSTGATFATVHGKVWEILGAASGASTNGSAAAVDAAFASWDNSAPSAAPGHNDYLAATGF